MKNYADRSADESPPPLRGKVREGGRHASIETARKLRRQQTDSERLLWSALRRAQIEGRQFRRQQIIGPFIVDFFCPSAKLIVELDGEPHTNDTLYLRDERRTRWLEDRGYQVMRFWTSELNSNLDGVVETIRQSVSLSLAPLPDPPPQGGRETDDDELPA